MRKGIIALVVVVALVVAAPLAWAVVQEDNGWGMMMGGSMAPMMSQMMNFNSPEFKQHIDQMQEFHDANGITCPGIDQMSPDQNGKSI